MFSRAALSAFLAAPALSVSKAFLRSRAGSRAIPKLDPKSAPALYLDLFRRTFDAYTDLVETSLRGRSDGDRDGDGRDALSLRADAGDRVACH